MAIEIDKLTLGEIDKIESLAGISISQLGEDDTPKGKMLAALAFVAKRREQMAAGQPPAFSWNDALDLTIDEANALVGLGDDEEDADEPDEADEDFPTTPED